MEEAESDPIDFYTAVRDIAGACGSTGWGEGNLRSCGSRTVVELMRQGLSPEQAALKTLERISAMARENHDAQGRLKPGFNVNFYVVNKRGEFAGASLWSGGRYAVADSSGARLQESAYLYKREKP